MPMITIEIIKGVFTESQKGDMLAGVTEAMVAVEGENMRPVTWVRIREVEQGDWAIGGRAMYAEDVHQLASGRRSLS